MGHKRKLGKILISAVASSALPTCSRFCITSRDRRPPFLLLVQCAIYNNLRSSSTYTTPREGSYFSWVQPYQAHTRCPDEGINVYSFALRPEEHQPSGTCNFSRIDNATLQLVLSNATVEGTKTAKVRVYATNYNVLRIMSGMGGLAYSN